MTSAAPSHPAPPSFDATIYTGATWRSVVTLYEKQPVNYMAMLVIALLVQRRNALLML